ECIDHFEIVRLALRRQHLRAIVGGRNRDALIGVCTTRPFERSPERTEIPAPSSVEVATPIRHVEQIRSQMHGIDGRRLGWVAGRQESVDSERRPRSILLYT